MPKASWADIGHLAPAALGIFFVSFADEILTARSFAGKHNQNVQVSHELLAMGAANAAADFTQGFSPRASPYGAVLGWVERLGRYADVSVHRQARVTPGVVVYRLDDRLFFANARYFEARGPPPPGCCDGPAVVVFHFRSNQQAPSG